MYNGNVSHPYTSIAVYRLASLRKYLNKHTVLPFYGIYMQWLYPFMFFCDKIPPPLPLKMIEMAQVVKKQNKCYEK